MEEQEERRGFEDLECYQLARQVLKEAYALAGKLPGAEKYNLADQMRRSATSAVLNIGEGYGRYHYLDRIRFFYIARGSLAETLSAFISCETLGYLGQSDLEQLRTLVHSALRSLNGYVRYIRKKQQGREEFGSKLVREDSFAYVVDPED
jgi:four helix bundle protein